MAAEPGDLCGDGPFDAGIFARGAERFTTRVPEERAFSAFAVRSTCLHDK
ncbi:MAG: hypothetical protein ABI481_12830 [Pyrinomonadaceae bacterium]